MTNEKKMTYFELIKLLDSVFPSKSQMDYTKITPEDLVKRFNDVIDSSGFSFNLQDIQKVRETIREYQKFVYGRKGNVVGEVDRENFDQNNYFIQTMVSKMKNLSLSSLSDLSYRLVDGDMAYNTYFFGNIDLIKSMVNQEEIRKYVSDVLYLTSSYSNGTSSSGLEIGTIVRDIMHHFGLRCSSYMGTSETYSMIEKILYNLMQKGKLANDGKDNPDLETAINRVCEILWMMALPAIEKTEKEERALEEKKNIETKDTITIEKPKKETPQLTELEAFEKNLAALYRKYKRCQKKAAENQEFFDKLTAINDQMAVLVSEIDKQKAARNPKK